MKFYLVDGAWSLIKHNLSAIVQVIDGAYNGAKLNCTNQAILSDNGLNKNSGYSVPLEIKPSGQFEPLYRTTLSVQVVPCLTYYKSSISNYQDGFLQVLDLYLLILINYLLLIFLRGRMGNCQFFHYLFTEQLLWHIVRSLRNTRHHVSSFSTFTTKEM